MAYEAIVNMRVDGHVAEIEWLHGEEGDAILLFDGDGDPVCSFGKEGGKFHAVDHRGKCVAEAARLEAQAIDRAHRIGQ